MNTQIQTSGLAPLTPLTRQEMFDKALFGIRKQGYRQSTSADVESCGYKSCAYVGKEIGLHCAVGHCLTEEMKRKVIEEKEGMVNNDGVVGLCTAFPDIARHLSLTGYDITVGSYKENREFLSDLQEIHDTIDSHASNYKRKHVNDSNEQVEKTVFEERMKQFAKEWHLQYNGPDYLESTGLQENE